MKSLFFCCAAGLALVSGLALAESAQLSKRSSLQSQPQADASSLGDLSKGDKVNVVRRAGAWSEVRTAEGKTGWVRMLDLRLESSAGASSSSSGESANPLANLFGGGSKTKSTVTTGVRGLDKEDLANAEANTEELQKTKRNTATRDAAQSFARKSGLSAQKIDIKEDAAPASRNNSNNSNDSNPGWEN